tara:strand:+ start:141 stop:728 length:588 start_codon:yes stop_codon:yes gene_type:complete
MPNAILRAGPFANEGDSFLDKPDPLEIIESLSDTQAIPVNCASQFPFRSYIARTTFTTTSFSSSEIQLKESGVELINAGVINQPRSTNVNVMFRYQAAIDFDIKLNYSLSASATQAKVNYTVQKKIGTNDIENIVQERNYSIGDSGSINLDEEVVISLTASVKPRFVGFRINLSVLSNPPFVGLLSDSNLTITAN